MSGSDKTRIYMRIAFHFLAIFAGMAVIVFLFLYMQSDCSKSQQRSNSDTLLDEMFATLDDNDKTVKMLTEHYNDLNRSAVSSMTGVLTYDKLMTMIGEDDKDRERSFGELYDAISAEILMVVDHNGKIVLSSDKNMCERNISDDSVLGKECSKKLITDGSAKSSLKDGSGSSYYLYSSCIKNKDDAGADYYLVTWNDCDTLGKEIGSLDDEDRIIGSVSAGTNGFVLVADATTDKFTYFVHNENEYTGKDIDESGIKKESLTDGYSGTQKIYGTEYYCTTKVRSSEKYGKKAAFIAAVPMTDIDSGRSAAIWSAVVFLTFALLALAYTTILEYDLKTGNRTKECRQIFAGSKCRYFYSVSIGKKILPVFMIGLIVIGTVSMYLQTMNTISKVRSQSYSQMEEAKKNLSINESASNAIAAYYDKQFESKALMTSFILEEQSNDLYYGDYNEDDVHGMIRENKDGTIEPVTDENGNQEYSIAYSPLLKKMCSEFGIDRIHVFNDNGDVVASSDDLWYFSLSKDKKDQSYPFRNVLEGKVKTYVQDAQENETGGLSQYIGCIYHYYTYVDDDGITRYTSKDDYIRQNDLNGKTTVSTDGKIKKHDSLIQICVLPERLSDVKKSTEVSHILAEIPVSGSGSMYAFKDDKDHTIIYSPNEREIGKPSSTAGIGDNAFEGEYCGFRRYEGQQRFDNVRLIDGIYVAASIPVGNMYKERNMITLWTIVISALFMTVLYFMLTVSDENTEGAFSRLLKEREKNRRKIKAAKGVHLDPGEDQMITVEMMSGRKRRIKAVEARWGNDIVPWESMGPEQKFGVIVKIFLSIFAIYLFILVMIAKNGGSTGFIISYVMSGDWDKGPNIFALTACVMTMLTIVVVTWFLKFIIDRVTFSMGTRSETIGHITESVIRYGSIIGGIFYCLYLVGLNAASLLTSAGILSVVVGLGAQSLIGDILAGISIVFEGAFRVGDIVTIGDFRGQVLEIGLRTTKIEDASRNIKIFNNSSISSIINMTRRHSYAICDISIDYGEDIEHIEAILSDEFPGIKSRLPEIEEGPFYRGVVSLGDSGVVIRIIAKCSEKDRIQLTQNLNREMYILFMKYNINIPYPQMEVSFKKDAPAHECSTEAEEEQADRFVKKQEKDIEMCDKKE